MTTPATPTPTWWQTRLVGLEKYGLAHWTYIVTAVIANLIGVLFHF